MCSEFGQIEDTLGLAHSYFEDIVRPRAQDIDQDPRALAEVLDEMGRRNLLALKCPAQYGGPAISEPDFRRFQEMSARYSGALSFLMTQHQSAVSLIAKSSNSELKSATLPFMGSGQRRIGIGISQLRRPGPPMVAARASEGGFIANGHVPWVTGSTFFDSFILGASLESGEALYAVVPFTNHPGITFSEPMRLAALESPQTVTATLENLEIQTQDVLYVKPGDWAKKNDMINIVLQGHFALGCAQAGVDQVLTAMSKRQHPAIESAASALQAEIDACREKAEQLQSSDDEPMTSGKLETRAWAIDLASRCAHAAIVAWGGAANSMNHPAQRIYREALVFTVSAQTVDIMEATLHRLTGRRN